MDKLKQYFQEHLSEMDVDSPHPDTWDRVVKKTTKIIRWPGAGIAACLIVLAGIAGWLLLKKQDQPPPVTTSTKTKPAEEPQIDEHYTTLVNTLIQRLRATPVYAESPQYFAVFTDELKQMEKDERRIRNDIQTYGPDDDLLEQWINLYQQKITLLKHWQEEIDKMNSKTGGEKTAAWHINI